MGFGILINRINSWFARVVWQRDAWDARLEAWSKSLGLRIVWIIWAAWGCAWLTRRMLLGLMWVAHALSCHLSRQMEYDADLHQTRLVGGSVVAETFQRFPRLALAEAKAWQTLESSWVAGMEVFGGGCGARFLTWPGSSSAGLEVCTPSATITAPATVISQGGRPTPWPGGSACGWQLRSPRENQPPSPAPRPG